LGGRRPKAEKLLDITGWERWPQSGSSGG